MLLTCLSKVVGQYVNDGMKNCFHCMPCSCARVYAQGLVDDNLPGKISKCMHVRFGVAPDASSNLGNVCIRIHFALPRRNNNSIVMVRWLMVCGFSAPLLAYAVARLAISANSRDCNIRRSALSDEADKIQWQQDEKDRADNRARVQAWNNILRARNVIDFIVPGEWPRLRPDW